MSDFDLEEQMEPEQFSEEPDAPVSKDVYKILKEKRKYEELHNKKQKAKHKATFHRINNINHYVCDHCGTPFKEKLGGSLIYNKSGEFAYCTKCLKELYPDYRPVYLANTMSKSTMLCNDFETKYNKGF